MKRRELPDHLKPLDPNDFNSYVVEMVGVTAVMGCVFVAHEDGLNLLPFGGWFIDAAIIYLLTIAIRYLIDLRTAARELLEDRYGTETVD